MMFYIFIHSTANDGKIHFFFFAYLNIIFCVYTMVFFSHVSDEYFGKIFILGTVNSDSINMGEQMSL